MSSNDFNQEKEQAIINMNAQFIHDITTPLAIVQMLAATLNNHLPTLLSAYQQLKTQGIEVDEISSEEYDALTNAAARIKILVQQVNQASKDHWQQLNLQFESTCDDGDITQISKPTNSFSLENSLDILVVEDDAIHQKIANKLLANKHQVDIAGNGQDAIEACRKKNYDLILMDLHMPIMGGQEAAAKIIQLTDSIPVIVGLTNRPLGNEKKQLLMQGFRGFIEKPLNLDELKKLIKELGISST
jgi:CheY-like chemotaxis protein